MSEQEKKPNQSFFVYRTQNKEFFLIQKELFREKRDGRTEQKTKRLFNCFRYAD